MNSIDQCYSTLGLGSQWGSVVGSWQLREMKKVEDNWTGAPPGIQCTALDARKCGPSPAQILSNCAEIAFPGAGLQGNVFVLSNNSP